MLPLPKKRAVKLHQDATRCYIFGKIFPKVFLKNNNYQKVRHLSCFAGKYRGTAHSISNLIFIVSNKIPVVFHNGSNYDYHFFIKE